MKLAAAGCSPPPLPLAGGLTLVDLSPGRLSANPIAKYRDPSAAV